MGDTVWRNFISGKRYLLVMSFIVPSGTWLTPFLKNLEMKVSHFVYQEQNQETNFENDQEILVHHYFPYLMVPSG